LPLAVILSAAKDPSCISPLPLRVPDPSVLRVGLHGDCNARAAAFTRETGISVAAS
jgi:hypothetical protein